MTPEDKIIQRAEEIQVESQEFISKVMGSGNNTMNYDDAFRTHLFLRLAKIEILIDKMIKIHTDD